MATVDLSNSSPVSDIQSFLQSAFNVPTTDAVTSGDNTGISYSLAAGVPGGQTPTNTTGNSLLDSINAISAFANNVISTGLSAYSSFQQSQAITDAAKRLGTTPTAVTGALNTVPITAQQGFQQGFLYLGIAAVGAVVLFKMIKSRG